MLSHLTIIDLSARLPGPLATHLLARDGAKVIKLENQNYPDPFDSDDFEKIDAIFKDWYKQINQNKKILRLDWNDSQIQLELRELLQEADIIIWNQSRFIQENFELKPEHFKKAVALVEVSAGEGPYKYMHDLNALGLFPLFEKHLEANATPPFLPLAGISFAQSIATKALAALSLAKHESRPQFIKVQLKNAIEETYTPLRPKDDKAYPHLHNGKFPCYQIYRTRDQRYIALAAVEQKFWDNFVEIFSLQALADKRFDTSGKTQKVLKKLFDSLTIDEVSGMIGETDVCLTRLN